MQADLTDLALDLGEAAIELDCGVALFIDEMQDLQAEELAAICQACHEAGQQNKPFFVIGAGLPNLPGILAEARSYAERLFRYATLGPLPAGEATAALTRPAQNEGVEWTDQAVGIVVAAADGYPYFLQEYGSAAWDVATRLADRSVRCRRGDPHRQGAARRRLLPISLGAGDTERARVPVGDGRGWRRPEPVG